MLKEIGSMKIQYASDIDLELSDMSYGKHHAGFDGGKYIDRSFIG